MVEKNEEMIKSLISLTGRTITSTALEAGIDPTNLSRSLKGHSTVSDQKMQKVLELLGLESTSGTLSPNRVHIWTMKTGDLFPLSGILSSTSQDFEMVYLVPFQLRLKDYLEFMRRPLLIRSTSPFPIKIVFRRRPPIFLPESKFQKEDFILVQMGLAKWRKIPKKYLYPVIEVESSTYEKFYSSNELSIQEFEQTWRIPDTKQNKNMVASEGVILAKEPEIEYDSGWTWEAIMTKAKEAGLTPREVAERLGFDQ